MNRSLVIAAIVILSVGFLMTAAGSIWTILTPTGTGVNFPAGAMYMGGMTVGLVGVFFGISAAIAVGRTSGR